MKEKSVNLQIQNIINTTKEYNLPDPMDALCSGVVHAILTKKPFLAMHTTDNDEILATPFKNYEEYENANLEREFVRLQAINNVEMVKDLLEYLQSKNMKENDNTPLEDTPQYQRGILYNQLIDAFLPNEEVRIEKLDGLTEYEDVTVDELLHTTPINKTGKNFFNTEYKAKKNTSNEKDEQIDDSYNPCFLPYTR